ncbi:hypothetical protein M23134_04953 [Microscilla marina ATCC 23134]|uniref:Uncharacterized protein n=1 Tax=Microscilla marina ATCC 23134 TaxID=313606 RepID=A1ZXE6_MICM2|nr:hypothetical protein M23134_04953 [Microscilla marina ATCC 23134]
MALFTQVRNLFIFHEKSFPKGAGTITAYLLAKFTNNR